MKHTSTILKYQKRIRDYLQGFPRKYVTIDDMTIDLGINKRNPNYEHAWRDLIAGGIIECCGNAVRINQ